MGILPSTKSKEPTQTTGKRSSRQMDFSSLPPLNPSGTVGFTNFRDTEVAAANKPRKKTNGAVNGGKQLLIADDSDEEDEDIKIDGPEELDDKDSNTLLSPEESRFRGELAEGLDRIKVCHALPFHIYQQITDPGTAQASEITRGRKPPPDTLWSRFSGAQCKVIPRYVQSVPRATLFWQQHVRWYLQFFR